MKAVAGTLFLALTTLYPTMPIRELAHFSLVFGAPINPDILSLNSELQVPEELVLRNSALHGINMDTSAAFENVDSSGNVGSFTPESIVASSRLAPNPQVQGLSGVASSPPADMTDAGGEPSPGEIDADDHPPEEKSEHVLGDVLSIGLATNDHPILGYMAMHQKSDGMREDIHHLAGVALASHGHPVLGYMAMQSGNDHEREEAESDRHRWLSADSTWTAGLVHDESLAVLAPTGFSDDIESDMKAGASVGAADAMAPGEKRGEHHEYGSSSGTALGDVAGVLLAQQGHPLLGLMAMHQKGESFGAEMSEVAAIGLASQGLPSLGYMAAEANHDRGRDEREDSAYDGNHRRDEEHEQEQHRWLSDEAFGQGQGQPVERTTAAIPLGSSPPPSRGMSAVTSMGMAAINEQELDSNGYARQ